jgi:inosose dehydratase
MKLACHTITWGGVVGSGVGVTSIKDAFYRANGSTEQALEDIAAEGYEGVELFDGNVVAAHEDGSLGPLLDRTGLQLVGVYSGANFIFPDVLEEEFWRLERALSLAAEYGAEHFVVGGGAQKAAGNSDADYDLLAAGLDRVAALADKAGVVASYHPHLSTMAESPDEIEQVFSRSGIAFCPDTAHLAAAGGDPAELIRTYRDRVKYVHLKDFTPEPFAFLPLGAGSLDLAGIVQTLRDGGYDGWLVAELDDYAGTPREAAGISKSALGELLVERT